MLSKFKYLQKGLIEVRILITGVSGQLGNEIYNISEHENYGTYLNNKPHDSGGNMFKIDLGMKDGVFSLVGKLKPDWIIHCAAVAKIDWCELNKSESWISNVEATKNIVEASNKFGSKILLVSTDYVFDGKKGFYKEDDTPNPVNFYGKTKLAAEWWVKSTSEYIIARSSLLYSAKRSTLMGWVLDGVKKGNLTAATDLYYSPTLVPELAECILKLIEMNVTGVFHTAGDGRASKYELIKKLVEKLGYNSDIVKPITSNQLNLVAPRVPDSSLDISKVKSLGIKFSKIDDAMKKFKMYL